MNYQYVFTVFTPTYNRARTLHRVYESLCAQTFRDFEWLIVDDGSTDETESLVSEWSGKSDFPIRYFYQENSGKHVAFNKAVQRANGAFFLPLDSDDACVPEALERFKFHWDSIPENLKEKFSAVTALCMDEDGRIVGDKFPSDVFDSDSLEIKYRYKIYGEKWGFHKTKVLKKFPFPEPEGVKFIPEGIVWSAIARHFKTRFVNEVLRIYYQENTGDENAFSGTKDPKKYASGQALWHESILNNEIDWFWYAPWRFLRSAILFSRYSFHSKGAFKSQMAELKNFRAKFLWLIGLSISYALYLKERKNT